MNTHCEIVAVDLANPGHLSVLRALLDEYARTPEGGAEALAADVLDRLPDVLTASRCYAGWLAFVDGAPAGLVNCFAGVSTFRAQPLLNIHDIVVSAPFRRTGIGRALLSAVEAAARALGPSLRRGEFDSHAVDAPFLFALLGGSLWFRRKGIAGGQRLGAPFEDWQPDGSATFPGK